MSTALVSQLKLHIPQRELCPNVIDGAGENIQPCGAECYFICFRHDDPISGCTRSCVRDQGCTHEPQYVTDEAVGEFAASHEALVSALRACVDVLGQSHDPNCADAPHAGQPCNCGLWTVIDAARAALQAAGGAK